MQIFDAFDFRCQPCLEVAQNTVAVVCVARCQRIQPVVFVTQREKIAVLSGVRAPHAFQCTAQQEGQPCLSCLPAARWIVGEMRRRLIQIVFILLGTPAIGVAIDAPTTFREVLPGRVLVYPKDHGAHSDYKTEWWYFTGHLTPEGESKPRFGFELVFFRFGLGTAPGSQSAWKVSSLYFAHFAVTDDKQQIFFATEQSRRGSIGDAGASNDTLDTWNGKWSAKLEGNAIHLRASASGNELALDLKPGKPIILHGDRGFSRKGGEDGDASYYSSFSRLVGKGTLKTPNENVSISEASAWMDQEFTSSESGEAKIGWDWFAMQLKDGRELMLYQLRDKSGKPTAFSAGTIIDVDGKTQHLDAKDFSIAVNNFWKSDKTGIRYPADWSITVPAMGRSFHVMPTIKNQELTTSRSTGVNYWEGRCTVDENGVSAGDAYVELVGYGANLVTP